MSPPGPGGRSAEAKAWTRSRAPLNRSWSSGVSVHCQTLRTPQPAGSVPGVLAYRAIQSGLVAPKEASLPVQVVHQSVVV